MPLRGHHEIRGGLLEATQADDGEEGQDCADPSGQLSTFASNIPSGADRVLSCSQERGSNFLGEAPAVGPEEELRLL